MSKTGLLCLPGQFLLCERDIRKGHRKASTLQQDWFLLLCVKGNSRSTASALQHHHHRAIHLHSFWLNCQKMNHEYGTRSWYPLVGQAPCRLIGMCHRSTELAGPPVVPIIFIDGSKLTQESERLWQALWCMHLGREQGTRGEPSVAANWATWLWMCPTKKHQVLTTV